MKRPESNFVRFLWLMLVLAIVAASIASAFFLTAYIYKITNLHLPALPVQIINSFLGLVITGFITSFFSRFFRMQQLNAFLPITQAMERISKGDFSIHLESEHDDGILKGLISSVNKMAQELSQMENMRQEFVSNVSHEIQSPLTSIRGFAQALKSEKLSSQERLHYLSIIEMESTRLSHLADDLLKLTSLDADQVKFEPHQYRLDKQIRSLILTCEPQWAEKKIEMNVDLDEVSISADEDLLNQVWLNLLHNSIKFTPEGGTIKVELCEQTDMAEFTITDTGIGIAPEDQVHIFERFYKADKSRTHLKEGSGLGLSIVKKIIELHSGRIDVQSKLGQGATFIVFLPVLPASSDGE
jgi:signal transduction histidine kinase